MTTNETNTTEPRDGPSDKPVAAVQRGAIRCAIWRNERKGYIAYTVTMERRYYDQDNQPRSTHSYGREDLLRAARVLQLAEDKIFELEERDRATARANAENSQRVTR